MHCLNLYFIVKVICEEDIPHSLEGKIQPGIHIISVCSHSTLKVSMTSPENEDSKLWIGNLDGTVTE